MDLRVGLDLGSTAIKAVLTDGGQMIWRGRRPTAPGQADVAKGLIEEGLDALGLAPDQNYSLASTGYGKNLYQGSDLTLDELSANARGLFSLSQGSARTIINIGGQDMKIIRLSDMGQVLDFRMNDKCAAGTGRFFELAARLLSADLEEFPALSGEPGPEIELNSTCAVFAETEIVSLMARAVPRGSIIRALHASVARRTAGLLGRVSDGLWLDGGPAMNRGLVAALEEELMMEVRVVPEPQYTVAFGAALFLG